MKHYSAPARFKLATAPGDVESKPVSKSNRSEPEADRTIRLPVEVIRVAGNSSLALAVP
jgi:hypothetical protein